MDTVGKPYAKKPFYVDAVQVTAENMKEVAEWCGGQVQEFDWTKGHETRVRKAPYVKVDVKKPANGRVNPRQAMAFVGDWVLLSTTGWKVYMDKAFTGNFEPLIEEPCGRVDQTADGQPCVLGRGHSFEPDVVGCRSLQDYKRGHK